MYKTIIDRKIRVAIIGCGRISKNHFGSIATHSNDVELVAACDLDPNVLVNVTKVYGHSVTSYQSLEDMLQ